jgi:hypothetical protein
VNANGGGAFTRLKVGMLRRIQSRISKFHAFALVALTAGLPHQSVPAGEPEVTCGNESQRACKGADWEYWAQFRFTGRNRACEYDLVELDGVCVNGARRTIPRSHDWTAWALAEG